MTDGEPRKIGVSFEVKPHAYDSAANPELFEGVLARRCIALVIDVIIIAIPVLFAAPAYFLLGAVHAIAYWFTISFLAPLILLVAFFNDRRRLLHDMLVGTIVINNRLRADALRRAHR